MTGSRPRVGVVAARPRPGRRSPLVPDLVAALSELGCAVREIDPDRGHHLLTGRSEVEEVLDLYVVKSGTEAALSYAGTLHARGALLLNPYPVAAACRDKVVQTRVLAGAGVPVPRTWMTTDPLSLASELDSGPLIFKDPRGSQGRGLAVVDDAELLSELRTDAPWLVMRYHPPEGEDLKLYRIGAEVFGVERQFPATTYEQKLGRPYLVPPDLRDVVLRCGDAFGIEVYGVDVIRSGGRHWVVDMSSFPGFKGVPDAGRRLAEHAVAVLGRDALTAQGAAS